MTRKGSPVNGGLMENISAKYKERTKGLFQLIFLHLKVCKIRSFII